MGLLLDELDRPSLVISIVSVPLEFKLLLEKKWFLPLNEWRLLVCLRLQPMATVFVVVFEEHIKIK
jgi:hypothetical protein